MLNYTELQITSNFSFLRGGSHPEELVDQAAAFGYKAIAITDRNSFAGIVRGHIAAREHKGMRIIPACRLDLLDGPSLLAYPTDQEAYSRLSGLLTVGNLRAEKGECFLYKADVYAHSKGIKFIAVPPAELTEIFEFEASFKAVLKEYREALGADLYLAATHSYLGDDGKKLYRLSQLSTRLNIPLVATNDVHYHHPDRRQLQDILTCVREKCTIQTAGFLLHQNAERYLKPIGEMDRLFGKYSGVLERTQEIAEACTFTLDSLKYIEPEEPSPDGLTPQQRLTQFTWEGARKRFPDGISDKVKKQIKFELEFIGRKNLASYFLRVHKYTRKAEELGILYQGRGSAANSTVCYCLAITAVNPEKSRLLFSRFMSDARDEWPDIDVDFEHERREEIIQFIYDDYGRDRAAIVATVTQERHKGAIRDVGKAMGLSEDTIKRVSGAIWDFSEEGFDRQRIMEQGLNPDDPHVRKVLGLTEQLMGFPRQLGQHTGGFVITRGKLSDICPVMNARMEDRTQLEWNKDDLEALSILKVDVLGLGMLTCIRKGFELAKQHYGLNLTLANVPQDDPEVYDMICHADTIGVFQIESRAQMSMLPRLKPKCFYDLVIEVAIVRPGPIQGDMVHPYLRRRDDIDPIECPKGLEEILKRTLGVPLFQEQAMEIAIVGAGFSPAEADQLRRSMATFKANGMVSQHKKKLVGGMVANGYEEEFAKRIFKQLEGFGSYGFPESHAASFAHLVYISSWLKCHYPDVFATALLNSQPMGFYQPAQIVSDARKHDVEVREVDVNYSMWDNIMEERSGKYCAVRLGFRQVRGMCGEDVEVLVSARAKHYTSIPALLDVGVSLAALEKLADADAFRSLGFDRRQALWEVSALSDSPVALFAGQPSESAIEAQVSLPLMTASEHVVQDYATTSLSLKAHPVSFVREKLRLLHIMSTEELNMAKDGDPVKAAGLVLVRQRPGTAKGICFITIEDETGSSNLVVFQKLFDKYRKEILQSRLLMVEGKLQREGEVVHVIAKRCYDLSKLLRGLTLAKNENIPVLTLSRADEKTDPFPVEIKKIPVRETLQKEIFSRGRNFR